MSLYESICLSVCLHEPSGGGGNTSQAESQKHEDAPREAPRVTGVCENKTPLDNKTGWNISFESTKSGAGLQFLLLGRMAKAHGKGVFFHRHRSQAESQKHEDVLREAPSVMFSLNSKD